MRAGAGNCCFSSARRHGVELVEELRRHRRRDQALALDHGADGLGHLLDRDLLEQVAVGAGLDRLVEVVLLVADREHEDLGGGHEVADLTGRLDAVDLGHADVHEHDVGGQLLGLGHGLLAVLGLGDDLDAVLGAEHDVEAAAEQRLVVGDEDADDLGRSGRPRRLLVAQEISLTSVSWRR